jgi:hypothetical protein
MPKWWPFGRKPAADPEAAFRQAEAALRQELAEREAAGISRQALLFDIEERAKVLEETAVAIPDKAQLRAYDLLYSDLRQALLHNLSAGKAREMAGDVAGAIGYYETAVIDQVASRFPYEHLRVIYNRQQQYDDARRICQAALDNPFLSDDDHNHFRTWANRFAQAMAGEA